MMAVQVDEPALLVRINQLYTPAMTDLELYDATRGVWVLGERRHGAKYALSLFRGEVLEVYAIHSWHPAGTTKYAARVIDVGRYKNRWEFVGELAPKTIREKYIGKSAGHYFKQGEANPVKYVNC